MAEKWVDYIITAVHFNSAGTHIESVRLHEDNGTELGSAMTKTRAEVVSLLERGYTVCTATRGSDGKWHYGAAVKIVVIDNQKFIRTKADGTKVDNLDKLPIFQIRA